MQVFYDIDDDKGHRIGLPLSSISQATRAIHPKDANEKVLHGSYCTLHPLDIDVHAVDLYDSLSLSNDIWNYMNYGPWIDVHQYRDFLKVATSKPTEFFYAIVSNGKAVGVCSYLRIDVDAKSIEVGHLTFSKLMKRTAISTEALILMARNAFDNLGYRRYEWKCNILNQPSINAAHRLGFTFEGIHRQAVISKGRNRDTAWFSILDDEWISLRTIYIDWLKSLDDQGMQSYSLSSKTRSISKQQFPQFSVQIVEKKSGPRDSTVRLVSLKDSLYGYEMRLLCQSRCTNSINSATYLLNDSNQRLRITRNHNNTYSVGFQSEADQKMNKKGKGTAFFLVEGKDCDSDTIRIQSCSEENDGIPIYIGFNDQGSFIAYQDTDALDQNVSKTFTINIIESFDNIDKIKNTSISLLKKVNSVTTNGTRITRSLTHWELQRFIMEGYLHVPSIVKQDVIKNALRFLNYHLGVPGSVTAGGAQIGFGKLSGSISNAKEIRELLYESLHIVEDILGENNCDIENPSAQIAFRFPEYNNKEQPKVIDTTHWHTDGLRKGRSHVMSLLLGICLSDVDEEYSGNLLVYPASHFLIHQCLIGPHGDIDKVRLKTLKSRQQLFLNEEYECIGIKDNINSNDDHHINEPLDLPSLGNPYQLKSKAGDIVLLHPDLAHEGGPNFSHDIRKMVYFRLRIKTDGDWEDVVKQHQIDLFGDMKNDKFKNILRSLSSFNIMTGPRY